MKCSIPHCSMNVELRTNHEAKSVPTYTKRKNNKTGEMENFEYIAHLRPTEVVSGMCRFHNLKELKVF